MTETMTIQSNRPSREEHLQRMVEVNKRLHDRKMWEQQPKSEVDTK